MMSSKIVVDETITSRYVLEHLAEAQKLIALAKSEKLSSQELEIGEYLISMAHQHFAEYCQKLDG